MKILRFSLFFISSLLFANDAFYDKGMDFYYGKNTSQDYKKAFEQFKKSSEKGNLDAITALGLMYAEGKGVDRDDQQAIQYLEQASDRKHPKALYILGVFNYQGIGITQNSDKAKELLVTSANLGNTDAQFSLHNIFQVEKNNLMAEKWLIVAADSGHKDAQLTLAKKMFANGDYSDSINWFEKIEKSDDVRIYLFLIHLNGLLDNKNKALAMSNIIKVSDQDKILQYANNFLESKETQGFALDLFRILRDRGNLNAYLSIAKIYEQGMGVEKDVKRAYNFVIAAARKGHIPSQRKVVDMYLQGIGTKKSKNKSVYWLKKLIKKGDLEAKKRLEELEKG